MSISGELSVDRTDSEEFRMEHVDRLLAWEFVHSGRCAGRNMQAYVLAERIGLTTDELKHLEEQTISHLSEAWSNYDPVKVPML